MPVDVRFVVAGAKTGTPARARAAHADRAVIAICMFGLFDAEPVLLHFTLPVVRN